MVAKTRALIQAERRNELLEQQIAQLHRDLGEAQRETQVAVTNNELTDRRAAELDKLVTSQAQEIADLKDLLHRAELDKARLEGHLERVHEFDPVQPAKIYEDQRPAPRRDEYHLFGDDANGTMAASQPWYRRRS